MLKELPAELSTLYSLEGKVALVTGASRGIGYAICRVLALHGAIVIGTARSDAGVQKIRALLEELNNQGTGVLLDVTSNDSISRVFSTIEEKFGAPLILINNAGIAKDQLCLRMKEDDWRAVLETNLTGVFNITKYALKGMIKARWGRVISIGSVSAALGNPGQVNYSASKAGLEGFSRALAREVASRGVTVNVIAPGFIETDLTRDLFKEKEEVLLSSIPLRRMGYDWEVALLVHFIASSAGGYITGATLPINGGLLMG